MARGKIKDLGDVVTSIPEGAHVALGGFAVSGCPMAFVHEMIRRHRGRLTISQAIGGLDTDMLVGAGLVDTLIYSGGSLDRVGLLERVNEAIVQGRVRAVEHSSLAISLRYLAGALGIPYMPTTTLLGSHILQGLVEAKDAVVAHDPFTGARHVQLRALQPDVAVLHVQMADAEGNCRIFGPTWDNLDKAKAAGRVIVLAEEIIDADLSREHPEQTTLAGLHVESVVPLTYSAHPTACYRYYDYDLEHLQEYARLAKTAEGFARYLDRFVLGVRDHQEYLRLVGGDRLRHLAAESARGY